MQSQSCRYYSVRRGKVAMIQQNLQNKQLNGKEEKVLHNPVNVTRSPPPTKSKPSLPLPNRTLNRSLHIFDSTSTSYNEGVGQSDLNVLSRWNRLELKRESIKRVWRASSCGLVNQIPTGRSNHDFTRRLVQTDKDKIQTYSLKNLALML